MNAPSSRDRGLDLIAAFKLVKAVLLILAGVGAFSLLRPATAEAVREWLAEFSMPHGQKLIERALSLVSVARPTRLKEIGLASIAYALLFAAEGVGLWMERQWAEYLTIFATGSLIPFEVYEIVRRLTVPRVLALVANVAAVVYLIYRVRHPSRRTREISARAG